MGAFWLNDHSPYSMGTDEAQIKGSVLQLTILAKTKGYPNQVSISQQKMKLTTATVAHGQEGRKFRRKFRSPSKGDDRQFIAKISRSTFV